ncbi:hypothetical protein H0H93_015441 [Arthromyces matolae]|nr:hypothetical protein H0H93_015441 [Arthromyces matolae]
MLRFEQAHTTINRIKYLTPSLFCTGDDDGVIKLWDPRQRECTRKYTQHFDYITDFLWLDDKKQLVATSAGWGDCVDRIPGQVLSLIREPAELNFSICRHPHSIDALCSLPPDFSGADPTSTILTGSSDGFVRAVEILPTKLLGVVADHGDWPVERIAIGGGKNQLTFDEDEQAKHSTNLNKKDAVEEDLDDVEPTRKRWWVGSVGHEETLRLTDLGAFFHEACGKGSKGVNDTTIGVGEEQGEVEDVDEEDDHSDGKDAPVAEAQDDSDSDESDGMVQMAKKRKRKPEKNPLSVQKKGRNAVDISEAKFFDDL